MFNLAVLLPHYSGSHYHCDLSSDHWYHWDPWFDLRDHYSDLPHWSAPSVSLYKLYACKDEFKMTSVFRLNRVAWVAIRAVFKGEGYLKDEGNYYGLQSGKVRQIIAENSPQIILQMYIILLTWNKGKGDL